MSHSVSRSALFAALLAAGLMAAGAPAWAKKKKADTSGDAADPAAPPAAGKETGADQAQDQERPKPILEDAEGPQADEKGNVNFVGSKKGHGKITVKAPAKENAKVYLEGRYFGVAPRTINKIPPGDYIVEITYPNGRSVTKPVSVAGDEEAIVELGGAADLAVPAAKPMAPEKVEKRLKLAKTIGIGAISLAVIGVGLGVWEYTVQKDYDKRVQSGNSTPQDREALDNLSKKGDTLALAANICFVGAAAGLVAAGIIGYPAYKARKAGSGQPESPDAPAPVSFMLAPGRTLGSFNAGMTYQF